MMQRFRGSKLTKALQMGYVRLRVGKRRGGRPGSAPGGGGGGAEDDNLKTVVNFSGMEYWTGFFPFINRMKSTDADWAIQFGATPARSDGRFNADYEPSAVPAGETLVRLWILIDDLTPTGRDYLKPGTYKITWTGNCVVDVITDVSAVSTVGNVTTFTLSSSATLVYVRVRNLTGSTASATNIKLFHADHEAAQTAGEILDPDFLTWLQSWTHCRAFRFLDWQAGNFGAVVNASDLTPLSYISWCRANLGGCPPEIIAEVAKKTGKPVWTVMWPQATDACMTAFYQRMKDHDPSGTWLVRAEGVNEMPWNSGFPGFAYLADTYAYTITVRDASDTIISPATGIGNLNSRLNSAYAHHLMRTWAAADAVFGASRVTPIACTQTSDGTQAAQYVKWFQTGFQGGQRCKDVLHSNSNRGRIVFATYFSSLRDPANTTTFKNACINDWGARLDQQWVDDWKASIDWMATNAMAHRINLFQTTYSMTCGFWTYEGGANEFIDAHATGTDLWANFSGTVNTGNNTLDMGASGVAWFTNGDRVKSTGALATGVDGNNAGWVRLVPATTRVRFYTSQAAYDADSANTGAGAVTLNAGTFNVMNMTRHDRIATKLYSLHQGARGLEIAQYIVAKLLTVGVRTYSLFAAPGLMRLGMQRYTYSFDAFSGGVLEADCSAVAYMKTLNEP
jgi:hypothetical protein